ncbi:MAG: type II 3-dehydroquinate dehydratase [Chitinispirillales bacterium]|jgi:3-dehydroquinate dehydratase-2|nr:type II 3-dehydroquinate dehydratase [Chitinispirillales bacterium]
MKIGLLNGPNLNRLGKREPEIYGKTTLEDIEKKVMDFAAKSEDEKIEIECFQSNVEGELVGKIQEWADKNLGGIIFNPGAYSHTSIALRDAISSAKICFAEVHISNIYKREEFRRHSYTAEVSDCVISGMGDWGYVAALQYLIKKLSSDKNG